MFLQVYKARRLHVTGICFLRSLLYPPCAVVEQACWTRRNRHVKFTLETKWLTQEFFQRKSYWRLLVTIQSKMYCFSRVRCVRKARLISGIPICKRFRSLSVCRLIIGDKVYGSVGRAGEKREENERDEFQLTSRGRVTGSGSLDGSTVERSPVWTSGRTGAKTGEFGT